MARPCEQHISIFDIVKSHSAHHQKTYDKLKHFSWFCEGLHSPFCVCVGGLVVILKFLWAFWGLQESLWEPIDNMFRSWSGVVSGPTRQQKSPQGWQFDISLGCQPTKTSVLTAMQTYYRHSLHDWQGSLGGPGPGAQGQGPRGRGPGPGTLGGGRPADLPR